MKKRISIYYFLIVTLSAFGQTYVSGDISGTWNKQGNPYFLLGDVTIQANSTLKIEPGVEIILGKGLGIDVIGVLIADGTPDNYIIFRSPVDTVYWDKILIQYSKNDHISRFNYCLFKGANIAIDLIINCKCDGTLATDILNSKFENINSSAIRGYSRGITHTYIGGVDYNFPKLEPVISHNTFYDNYNSCSFTAVGTIAYSKYISRGSINSLIVNNSFNNIKNYVIYTENGGRAGDSHIRFENNVISHSNKGTYAVDPFEIKISNNIFYCDSVGVIKTGELSNQVNSNCFFGSYLESFSGYPEALGQEVMSNLNGDPCDVASNIFLDPLFTDTITLQLEENSPAIDAGQAGEEYYDICIPPGKGTEINDIGIHGGFGTCGFLRIKTTPQTIDVPALGESRKIIIENTGVGAMNWVAEVAEKDTSWLKIDSNAEGTDTDSILVSILSNNGYDRSGEVKILAPAAWNGPYIIEVKQGNMLPDLYISKQTLIPASIEKGGLIIIQGQFKNTGNGPSTPSKLHFYFSEDNLLDLESDVLLGSINLPGIEKGITETFVSPSFRVPVEISNSSISIFGIINADSTLLETNHSNNILRSSINISEIKGPTEQQLTTITPESVSITWTDNTDIESGYEIYRSIEGPVHESFELIHTTQPNIQQYIDTTLLSDTLYYYKIRAINDREQSYFTDAQGIRTGFSGMKLMAWYPFNGNAIDETGNGNDGTVQGAELTLDKDSTDNNAFMFDGIDNYIDVGGNLKPSYPFAFSAWIMYNTFKEDYVTIIRNDRGSLGVNYGAYVLIDEIGKLVSFLGGGGSGETYSRNTTIVPVITPGIWHHVAVNFLSWQTMEIFVNGLEQEGISTSKNGSLKYTDSIPGAIGSGDAGRFLQGKMDEVRIYGRELNTVDIELLSGYRANHSSEILNLQAVAVSSEQIKLSWIDNFSDEYGFEILRSLPPGDNFGIHDTVPANVSTYSDVGLEHNTMYYYKVRAIHPGGYSSVTETVSAVTHPEGVPYAESKSACYGSSIPSLEAEGESIRWYSDAGLTNQVFQGNILETGKTEIGTYTYWVTQQYLGSESYPNEVSLVISPTPELTLMPYKDEIHAGEQVTIDAQGVMLYHWSPEEFVESISGGTAIVSPGRNTVFTLKGYNEDECYDSISIPVFVFCDLCTDENVLFEHSGHMDHGCTDRNYNQNANCAWTILPSGAKEINLKFNLDSFDIKAGDKLMVYDGSDATGTLLGTFDNNNVPDNTILSGNSMFVQLITDDSKSGTGFQAWYWTDQSSDIQLGTGEKEYVIYPNPAKNVLYVRINSGRFENGTISVLDLTGRKLKIVTEITRGIQSIDLEGLKPGVHIVELSGDEIIRYESFVVR